MNLPNTVQIKEVGPRDGLQNESVIIPTEVKVAWINQLLDAGINYIELTSFVSPKWIPALADSVEVARRVQKRKGVTFAALVPNMKGLERALETNIDEVSIFMSASQTHNLRNINKTIEQTFPVLQEVTEQALQCGKTARGYISTVFGCPYEGEVKLEQTLKVAERLLEFGVRELSFGDTIGVANPRQVYNICNELLKRYPARVIALHFHDTYGRGLANVMAAMQQGIETFDSAAGGLGGCPYAPGASGNVATEDIVSLFETMNVATNIALPKLVLAGQYIQQYMNKPLSSRYLQACR